MDAHTQFWRDAAMPHVESRRACSSRACYKAHSHPTYSIGAVDQGQSLFSSEGKQALVLEPGTLVLVPAHRVHACNPQTGFAWSYQMLHLGADWLASVRAEYAATAHPAGQRGAVRLIRDPAMYEKFCRLNDSLFSTDDVQEKEAALIEFIGDCDAFQGNDLGSLDDASPTHAGRLGPALDMLRAAPLSNVPLALLARAAGMTATS